MTVTFRESAGADSSHEIMAVSDPRYLEIDRKHEQLSDFLRVHEYDAIILQQPWNFAWLTAGGTNQSQPGKTAGSLYLSPEARVVLTNNVDSTWLFQTQIPRLGFQVKERPWTQSPHLLISDLCRGRNVVSDTGVALTKNVDQELKSLRLGLTAREEAAVRELGKSLTSVVERTARKVTPGETELDIAGGLIHRLLRAEIEPVEVHIYADDRSRDFRNAPPSTRKVKHRCTVSAIGRKEGLMVGARRTVAFGEPDSVFMKAYETAALCQATGRHFSQSEWELEEIWNRVQRIYEKFSHSDEWRNAEQGNLIGYQVAELPIVPKSQFRLSIGMLINWTPSVDAAQLGDTILVDGKHPESITRSKSWPFLKVVVKGEKVRVPDVLVKS